MNEGTGNARRARATRAANAASAVTSFFEQVVKTAVEKAEDARGRRESVLGLMLRLICWGRTLRKLTEGSDFQGACAAARGITEATVSLVHLAYSEDPDIDMRLRAWEESEKLRLVDARMAHEMRIKRTERFPSFELMVAWADQNRDRIRSTRMQLWGTTKHMDHWHGPGGLEQAARAADEMNPNDGHQVLEDLYQTHLRRMQWSLHGVGLTFERTASRESFDDVVGLAQMFLVRAGSIAARAIEDALGIKLPPQNWNEMQSYVANAMGWEEEVSAEARRPEGTPFPSARSEPSSKRTEQ